MQPNHDPHRDRLIPTVIGWLASQADRWMSFCCSGKRQVARQAKDHPKAAYGLAHIPGAPRSEGSKWLEAQAHLHTTLNKSRDEKLDLADACQSYDFGKRACGMVAEFPRSMHRPGTAVLTLAGRPPVDPTKNGPLCSRPWIPPSGVGILSFCCSGKGRVARQA